MGIILHSYVIRLLLVAGMAMLLTGCGKSADSAGKKDAGAEHARLVDEYRLLLIQKNLSKLKEPYIVLDFERNRLEIQLAGVVVWHAQMEYVSTDSAEIASFKTEFLGKKKMYVRRLTGKHLYSAEDQTPDSILAIVADAIEADPDSLQRHVPERFRLYWGAGLYLEVRTDISGHPLSRFKNALTDLGGVVHAPFGNVSIRLKMAPDDALTLYRASNLGMFTFLNTHPKIRSLSRRFL